VSVYERAYIDLGDGGQGWQGVSVVWRQRFLYLIENLIK
jgi:hypothetical protein